MPRDPNFPKRSALDSFYEGVYSEETLTLIGDQLCRLNVSKGIVSYDKFVPSQSSTGRGDPFNKFRREEEIMPLRYERQTAFYGFRTMQLNQGCRWLDRTMYDLGRNTGLHRESGLVHAVLNQCETVSFSGGSSRETVSEPFSWCNIHRIKSRFQEDRVPRVSRVLRQGPDFCESSLQCVDCFVLIVPPRLACDIRDTKGFVQSTDNQEKIGTSEIGRINDVRVLQSPNLPSYPGSGANIHKTKVELESSHAQVDVHPTIFASARAWASVPLRKYGDQFEPRFEHSWEGEDGSVEVNYVDAFAVQNPSWITVLEVGVKRKHP